ncbi:Calcium-binding EF hand family protein [Raphanus sativus]|nr:Calcium-binding EF hand family protein [Raphanus sativus]
MTPADVQKYAKVFVQVDTDRDGKITGPQARNLFLSWKLPRDALRQVWDLSDQDNDSMLSLREFCIAVYLMERYREGRPLPPVKFMGPRDHQQFPKESLQGRSLSSLS